MIFEQKLVMQVQTGLVETRVYRQTNLKVLDAIVNQETSVERKRWNRSF